MGPVSGTRHRAFSLRDLDRQVSIYPSLDVAAERLPAPGGRASRRTATGRPREKAAGVAPGRGGSGRRRWDDHGSRCAAGGHVRLRSRRDGLPARRTGSATASRTRSATSGRSAPHHCHQSLLPRRSRICLSRGCCTARRLPATEVARRAGHGVAVLLKIYAHCIDGQADAANQRITDALGAKDTEPEPGREEDGEGEMAS